MSVKSIEDVTASPLDWPDGWERTPSNKRILSRFKPLSFHRQCRAVLDEVERLGGIYGKISTDLKLRQDGLPYSNQRKPDDPGVAVWFMKDGKTKVVACDQFLDIEDNLRAIEKSIEALRGLDRWGCSTILDRAMKGMESDLLPAPPMWWEILGVDEAATAEQIRSARNNLLLRFHPDRGGDEERSKEINRAFVEAKELGLVR